MDPPPGKPLQHLHRQGITEPSIQFIPIIQQRPLVAPTVSKFQGLIDAANSRANTAAQPALVMVSTKRRGRGRPRGKRSDPNFEQVTTYLRKHTHQGVKIALVQEGRGQEFSELVEDLLAEWLKARK